MIVAGTLHGSEGDVSAKKKPVFDGTVFLSDSLCYRENGGKLCVGWRIADENRTAHPRSFFFIRVEKWAFC